MSNYAPSTRVFFVNASCSPNDGLIFWCNLFKKMNIDACTTFRQFVKCKPKRYYYRSYVFVACGYKYFDLYSPPAWPWTLRDQRLDQRGHTSVWPCFVRPPTVTTTPAGYGAEKHVWNGTEKVNTTCMYHRSLKNNCYLLEHKWLQLMF